MTPEQAARRRASRDAWRERNPREWMRPERKIRRAEQYRAQSGNQSMDVTVRVAKLEREIAGFRPANGFAGPPRPDRPALPDQPRPANPALPDSRVRQTAEIGPARPDGPAKGALGVNSPEAYEEYVTPSPPLRPANGVAGLTHHASPAVTVQRVDQVVECITATGQPPPLLKRADRRAISDCSASAALIADAFVAARRGAWGGKWLRENLSLSLVVKRLDGYVSAQMPPEISDRPGPPLVLVTD
jgi:hypothetical protein